MVDSIEEEDGNRPNDDEGDDTLDAVWCCFGGNI